MITLNSLALVFFQDAASSVHDVHSMRIYVAFIAAALMLQALGILLVAVYAAKFLAVLHSISRNVEEKALPVIQHTGELVRELTPKINSITTNVEQVSYTLREKVDELGQTVSE